MGQPGHSVLSRLGVTNNWNYNPSGIYKNKKSFLNSLLLKKAIRELIEFSCDFNYFLTYNVKWFNFNIIKKTPLFFWRKIQFYYKNPADSLNIEGGIYPYRNPLFESVQSKVQIYRYEKWFIASIFIYKHIETSKLLNKTRLTSYEYLTFSWVLYFKYLIIVKLKMYNNMHYKQINKL